MGSITTVSYALAYFLPIILNNSLGYTTGVSQCLIAPPYAFAGFVMYGTGWFGDRFHVRGPPCAFNAVLAIIGLAILGFAGNGGVRYFGVFLATLVGFGALGGIVGTTTFRSEDRPDYVPGISVAIGSQILILILVGFLTLDFKRQNAKADRGEKVLEEGNEHFRYTY